MKKIALAALAAMMLMFGGCAGKITNFNSVGDWKADKEGPRYAAVVLTAEIKDGKNIGTAEIIENGEFKGKVVKFTQKSFFVATTPLQKGAVIWVTPYDNKQ
ncbi:MAG: hypothetical protein PHG82_01540 [Candidatus Gracilibacteria bacterium]|nr:hypothetical protein [Candidatus Gracilibacteria bacterium]